jgi:hypothetical protein
MKSCESTHTVTLAVLKNDLIRTLFHNYYSILTDALIICFLLRLLFESTSKFSVLRRPTNNYSFYDF